MAPLCPGMPKAVIVDRVLTLSTPLAWLKVQVVNPITFVHTPPDPLKPVKEKLDP